LWVIHGVHTQLELRLIWVPTWAANKQLVVLGLDDLTTKLVQLETEATAIALGDAVLAG